MTTLYTQIKELQLQARKEKSTIHINLFTTLLGDIQTASIGAKNNNLEISDSSVIKVISKFIKNTKETLKLKPSNQVATLELEILETFLPKPLTDTELQALVAAYILVGKSENVQGGALVGFVMKQMKEGYPDRYDASKVKDIILNT